MQDRLVGHSVGNRRLAICVCLFAVVFVSVGCLSTWNFQSNDKKMKIVSVDQCAEIFNLDYLIDNNDTVKFMNHSGKKVILEFPTGTVTAEDEDPSTGNIVEVTVKRARTKKITISANPPLTLDSSNNGVIMVFIKDPCHGGANMIIEPAN